MDTFRAAFNTAKKLPDAQAESSLRGLLRQYPGLSPEDEGDLRYTLGIVLYHQGKIDEARSELQQACSLLEHSPGAGPALVLTALARMELACQNASESVAVGRKALKLLRERLAPGDPRMAPSLFSLSFGEYETRNLPEAEVLCLEAKKLWEEQKGPESLEVSTCLNNLGRIYEEMNRPEEGIAHHRAALAIRRKVLGDHPETAFSAGNLGTALAAAGKWREATEMLEEAIACYARCGHTAGNDIEGYRRNLDVCRSALAREKS